MTDKPLLHQSKSGLIFALDTHDPPPDFIGPRARPCRLEDHRWTLVIEEGRPSLNCLDPCSEERKAGMDTSHHGPMCDVVYEFIDGMHMEGEIPVVPRIETQYWPGELGGQGETDAWLVVERP